MSGITPQGFLTRRLEDIILGVRATWQASLGPYINTGADSVLGAILGGVAPEIALVWEGLSDLYQSYNPDQATGDQLDRIARLYGLVRLGAQYSTTILSVTGDAGTIIPIGSRVSTATGIVVQTTLDGVIPPSGVLASLPARAVIAGATQVAPPDALTQIVTPVTGWDSVSASTALSGGRDREDDPTLRARLAAATAVTASVEGAIRTAILQIGGIDTALVISNRTLSYDTNGTPPKAYRVIISPDMSGDADIEEEIARVIWRTAPAGIEAAAIGPNSRTATIVDSQGITQTVGWEYPVIVPVEYTGTLLVDLSVGPLTSAEVLGLAYEALERWTNALPLGEDVAAADVITTLRGAIPGLLNVTGLEINGSTAGYLPLAFNDKAVYNNLTAFTVTPL